MTIRGTVIHSAKDIVMSGNEISLITGNDSVPARSREIFNSLLTQFGGELAARAQSLAANRGSQTITDADIHHAYEQITSRSPASRWRRGIGDATMVVGSILVPLANMHWLFSIIGIFIISLGVFIREFWND